MPLPSATEGDADSALLELFEFVDEWAPDAASSPSSEGSVSDSTTRRRQQKREVDLRRRQKKKREREMLKLSVDELSERLERLQREKMSKPARVGARGDRILSEVDNQALKSKLAVNLAVISALQDALSPNVMHVQLDASVTSQALEMQREILRKMVADNKSVFQSFPPLLDSPFLLRSETKVDAIGNPRVEHMTALEVDRSLPQVSMIFGSGLRSTSPFWDTVCSCIESEGQVTERAFALGDRVLDFQKSNLRSVGLVQKRQQFDDCLDIMWSSQIFHPTAGVTIITGTRIRVTSISSSRSLIQASTSMSAHDLPDRSGSVVPASHSQAVRNVLVRAFGDRLAAKHKLMLKILLQATGRDDVASLVA